MNVKQLILLFRRNARALIAAGILSVLSTGIPFVLRLISKEQSVSYPWKSTLLCAFVFVLLFLFLSEKHLITREKALFISLVKSGNRFSVLLEAFFQLLLAAVVFLFLWLLGNKQLDFFRTFFYIVISLVCSVAVTHLNMPKFIQCLLPWVAYAVLVAYSYCVLIIYGYTSLTEKGLPLAALANQVIPWVHLIGLLLVIAEFKIDRTRALLLCLTGIPLYFAYQAAGFSLLSEFCGFILLGNLFSSPRSTVKVVLGVLLLYIVFLCIGILCHWINNIEFFVYYGGITYTIGMAHPNLVALVIMCFLLLIWYLWLSDHPFLTFLIFFPFVIGLWFFTYSRTVVISLVLFPIVNLIKSQFSKNKYRFPFLLLALLPLIFSAISIILMNMNGKYFPVWSNFFARFTIPYSAASDYGLRLFGGAPQTYIIDNLFLHILVYYGIVPTIIIVGLLTWIGLLYFKNQQYNELVLLTIFMVYSLMENALIHMPFGFAALLVANIWSKSVKIDSQNKKGEIGISPLIK